MRTWSLAAAAAALGLLPIGASADDITKANNQISVDFAEKNFGYTETGSGIFGTPTGKLDTETGWTPGVSIAFSAMQNWGIDNLYFMARYSYYDGSTSYVGGHLFPPTPFGSVRATDGARVHDVDLRFGKGFDLGGSFMVTPFFGTGYQNWDRGVNAGEDYTHGYYGGGLLVQVSPVRHLVLSVDGLAGQTVDSHIDVSGPLAFSARLGDSTIYKVGGSADYAITPLIHVNAGVEWEHFDYGMSALHPIPPFVVWEPRSDTSNLTARVGVGIAFGGSDYDPLK